VIGATDPHLSHSVLFKRGERCIRLSRVRTEHRWRSVRDERWPNTLNVTAGNGPNLSDCHPCFSLSDLEERAEEPVARQFDHEPDQTLSRASVLALHRLDRVDEVKCHDQATIADRRPDGRLEGRDEGGEATVLAASPCDRRRRVVRYE
jgi:hypothetical protein